jgi:outer membrane protein OmpA-like peptidoglycan-associated protein
MTDNLLSLVQSALGDDFAKLAGQFLGESVPSTRSALTSLLPAVLGGVAQKGATPEGASSLLSLINGSNLDTTLLDNVAGMFGSGSNTMSSLMKLGTSSLVPALFGDKAGGLVNALAGAAGIKSSSATNLIAMIVPLIFTFLKKYVSQNNLSGGSLSTLLKGQGEFLSKSLDSRLTGALGYATPAAMLSGLGGAVAGAARSAGAAVASGAGAAASTAAAATTATRSGLMRWLPWLIGAAVLLALWNMFQAKPTPPAPAPAPTAAAPAAVPAPAPAPAPMAAAGFPFKVYFDTGSAAIGPVANATITAAAEAIRKDNAKVALTGYTDKTGDVAANEKLAKDRATAVRDALKAAGIAEGNIELRPPVFVEVGTSGPNQEARRVEINKL